MKLFGLKITFIVQIVVGVLAASYLIEYHYELEGYKKLTLGLTAIMLLNVFIYASLASLIHEILKLQQRLCTLLSVMAINVALVNGSDKKDNSNEEMSDE